MNCLSLITGFSFVLYLIMGVYVFSQDPRSRVHKLFFLMIISMAIWAFCSIFVYSAKNESELTLWMKLSTFGFMPFFILALHFSMSISGFVPNYLVIGLLYIPPVILTVLNISHSLIFKDYRFVSGRWVFLIATDSPGFYLFLSYFFFYITFCVILYIKWYRKSDLNKEKYQAAILGSTLVVSIIGALLEALILPLLSSYRSLQLTPLFLIIWASGISYAISRFRFLSISPEIVSEEILETIDELIILLDPIGRLLYANPKAIDLFALSEYRLRHSPLFTEHINNAGLIRIIDKVQISKEEKTNDIIGISYDRGQIREIDFRVQKIKDRFGDNMGSLIIGHDAGYIQKFREIHSLTAREIDIIREILMGKSNKEIAERLSISERTVKTHLSHIYNKVPVDNKYQLVNYLRNLEPRSWSLSF